MAKDVVMSMMRDQLETWVEGIDKKNVDLQTLKGELSLSRLKLRSEEIESRFESTFGLRIHLHSASVGELRAKWSWSNLLTTPVRFELHGLELRIEVLDADAAADTVDRHNRRTVMSGSSKKGSPPDKPSQKTKSKGVFGLVKRTAGAAAGVLAGSEVKRYKRRITELITDQLTLTVTSIKVGIQLAESVVCGCVLNMGSTVGEAPAAGEVQHQHVELEGFGVYVNHLERDFNDRIVNCNPSPAFMLHPSSLTAVAVRTSGRRFKDVRGLDLDIKAQSLQLAWSDMQCDALVCGLLAVNAWDARIPKPKADQDDDQDFSELARGLSADDVTKLQDGDTPLAEGAEFVARLNLQECMVQLGMESGKQLARFEINDPVEMSVNVSEHKRRGNCVVKNIVVSQIDHGVDHGFALRPEDGYQMAQQEPLFLAPRCDQAPALDLSFVQDVPEPPQIGVRASAAEVRLLPGWASVLTIAQSGAGHLLRLKRELDVHVPRQERPLRLDIKVRRSSCIVPECWNDFGSLALQLTCHLGILSNSSDEPHFLLLQDCAAEFVKNKKGKHLFKELSITVDRTKDASSYEVKVPPVTVCVTLNQFEGISTVLSAQWLQIWSRHSFKLEQSSRATKRGAPQSGFSNSGSEANQSAKNGAVEKVSSVSDVKVDLHTFRIILIDSDGLASGLALMLAAASVDAKWSLEKKNGFIRGKGLQISTVRKEGPEDLLEKSDMELIIDEHMTGMSTQLLFRVSVNRLHVLKLFCNSLFKSLQDAGLLAAAGSTGGGQSRNIVTNVGRVCFVLDDPEGLTGYLAVSAKVSGLAIEKNVGSPIQCEFDYCNVQVSRAEDGYSDENAAWLTLLRVSGDSQHRAAVTFGTSISMNATVSLMPGPQIHDDFFGKEASPAFRSESVGRCSGSFNDRDLKGDVQVGTLVLNTTDAYLQELAAFCGELAGGLRGALTSKAMVFRSKKHGLKMKGAEVEKASANGEAAKGGIVVGSMIMSVGGTQVKPEDDVLGLLKSAELPSPVQFITPKKEQQDIQADLRFAPILIKVAYFRTSTGREVHNMNVQLGEVSLQQFTGSPNKLVEVLGKRYAVEMAKHMPWFSESMKAAASILGSSASTAVGKIQSKLFFAGMIAGHVANVGTVQLASVAMDKGRQVGDFAVDVLTWVGLIPGCEPKNSRSKTLTVPSEMGAVRGGQRRISGQTRAGERGQSSPPKPVASKKAPKKARTANNTEDAKPQRNSPKQPRSTKTSVDAPATSAMQCSTPGCSRQAWNAQPGQSCCRTCPRNGSKSHGPECERKAEAALTQAKSAPKRRPKGKARSTSTSTVRSPDRSPVKSELRKWKIPSRTPSWTAPDAFFDENEYDIEVPRNRGEPDQLFSSDSDQLFSSESDS